MRFALRSHRDPHVQIGHGAPRSLQTQIDRQLTNASSRKYEPRLLGDDDYRLKFLNRDTIAGGMGIRNQSREIICLIAFDFVYYSIEGNVYH